MKYQAHSNRYNQIPADFEPRNLSREAPLRGVQCGVPYVCDGNGTRYPNMSGVPVDYRVARYFRRGFDGLAHLIRRCHGVGIEVHPRVLCGEARLGEKHASLRNLLRPSEPPSEKIQHILQYPHAAFQTVDQ